MRLLILSCSATKAEHPDRAIDLYDGPSFRTLRAWQRGATDAERQELAVWILSAEHGLIPWDEWVEPYDRRMTRERAAEVRKDVEMTLAWLVPELAPAEVFLMLGETYMSAVPAEPFGSANVIRAPGGIGEKLGALRRWLSRQEAA